MVRLRWVVLADNSRELQYQTGTPVVVEGAPIKGEYHWSEWLTVPEQVVEQSWGESTCAR